MNEDIQDYLIKLSSKVMRDIEDEAIRDIDGSKLDTEHNLEMLRVIGRAEYELDVLLTLTEEIGGFGSSYPKKCLESLKIFRTILEMELKNGNDCIADKSQTLSKTREGLNNEEQINILQTEEGKQAFLKAINQRFRFTKEGQMIPKNEDSYNPIILSEYMENE